VDDRRKFIRRGASPGVEFLPLGLLPGQLNIGQTPGFPNALSEDILQLQTKHPAPTASADVDAKWIKPSASANLRKGPKSSTPIVGVIAKEAKLRVISRKRGWVEVSNPATSQQGWIYAGVVDR
jgi:hypothetical protein